MYAVTVAARAQGLTDGRRSFAIDVRAASAAGGPGLHQRVKNVPWERERTTLWPVDQPRRGVLGFHVDDANSRCGGAPAFAHDPGFHVGRSPRNKGFHYMVLA
jgi:hypothetical protein